MKADQHQRQRNHSAQLLDETDRYVRGHQPVSIHGSQTGTCRQEPFGLEDGGETDLLLVVLDRVEIDSVAYNEIRAARSLPRPLGEGWGEGTIGGETTFHGPGWLGSPLDR